MPLQTLSHDGHYLFTHQEGTRMKKILIILFCITSIFITGCNANSPSDAAIEFKEIAWNSSPEYVMEALGFDEAQIVETKSQLGKGKIGLSKSDHLCTLYAADFKAYGENVTYAEFRFENTAAPGKVEYGLSHILLHFDSQSDINTIVSNLDNAYGKGVKEYPMYIDSGEPEVHTASDYKTFWLAKSSINDVLTSKDKDLLLDYILTEKNSTFTEATYDNILSNSTTYVTFDTHAGQESDTIMLYFNAGQYTYFKQLLELAKAN